MKTMPSVPESPRLLLSPDPQSPGTARKLVAEALHSHVDAATLRSALLILSELVANAVIHAGTEVAVAVKLLPDGAIRIEVADGRDWPPRMRMVGPDAVGGRGLVMVDALSRRWGVEPRDEGKTVWAETVPARHLITNDVH